jgi:uncharacterized membrane protein
MPAGAMTHAGEGTVTTESERSLITSLQITYGLHAFGLAIGAFGAASVVGSFIFGWPSIIAVIINYVKRGDARGTWLESHFAWQIRTFWWAVLWSIIVFIASIPTLLLAWPIGLAILGIWAVYRIVKGWMRLNDRKAVG